MGYHSDKVSLVTSVSAHYLPVISSVRACLPDAADGQCCTLPGRLRPYTATGCWRCRCFNATVCRVLCRTRGDRRCGAHTGCFFLVLFCHHPLRIDKYWLRLHGGSDICSYVHVVVTDCERDELH